MITASIFFHEDDMIIKTIEIGTCVLLHLSALESKSVHLNFTISVCMYLWSSAVQGEIGLSQRTGGVIGHKVVLWNESLLSFGRQSPW